jgi:hypothetical protein
MTIPDNIEREHIKSAMQEIDSKGIPSIFKSKGYDVIFEQKHYPPKYVVFLANNKYTDNNKLTMNDFNTTQARKFLNDLDFVIEKRKDIEKKEIEKTIEEISFPSNFSLEKLAEIYRDIEEGKKDVNPPIHIPFDCNTSCSYIT